jgi:DNA-binding transcriptional regulator YiaG
MSNTPTKDRDAPSRQKKFPIRCLKCHAREVRPAVIPYSAQKNHDGRLYDLHVPDLHVNKCGHCGAVYMSDDADEQICAALRAELRLLSPEDISANLENLALSQKDFAACVGIAAETVSRWVTGAVIQSKAMDNLLRLFFSVPEARGFLRNGITGPVEAGAKPVAVLATRVG